MKRKRIPTALHSELTEYASLLRALRTKDAMDLTVHLSGNVAPPAKPKRKRDHWTRWPLLLEDVPIPEWTLEDEVTVIASRVIKAHPTPTFPVTEGPLEHDDPSHTDYVMNTEFEEDDPDYPFYVPYLTSVVATLLSTTFSLLAKHTPSRPASMQNRIEPLNWRSVIDVIVACDIPEYSNPKILENVIRRMEAIYGPSFSPLEGKMATSYRAVERMKNKAAATDRLHKLHEEPMASYFTQASPPPYRGVPLSTLSPPILRRKRDKVLPSGERNYKVRKRWVPKSKRGQEREMDAREEEYQGEKQSDL
ncbi:hypothetical protein BYT27DRAFT_7337171 [Phlegmacium glaucopus]|nr:hypothetical protein BYT27DRAFT_7337171 [Phlegmacium glaucopus]